jgi:hypothetical protein
MASGWPERAWTLALVLLIVNDHVLKGAGWLPAVVTGKLSDYAGLVVAPVLVAVLMALSDIRGPRARLVCFAAVVAPFVTIKLSTDAAHVLESALDLAGVRSRIWSDPTDLVALGVLPLAWRVSAALEEHVAETVPRLRHVLGAMLGGVACLASSAPAPVKYETSAYLVSMAPKLETVEVSRVTAVLDCTALDASVTALDASDFQAAFCSNIGPADVLPLDRDFVNIHEDTVKGPFEEEPPCDAVLLGVRGLDPTIVFWRKAKGKTVENGNVGDELDSSAVYLEPVGDARYIAGSKVMHVRTLDGPVPEIDCSSLEKPAGLP